MELKIVICLILVLSALAEPIEETSTILIPATSDTDNKTVQILGPARSIREFRTTHANDKVEQETAPAMAPPKKDFDRMEKPANLTTHSRPNQDNRPLYMPDMKVHVAGPPDEPPPNLSDTERPPDVIPPAKVAREVEPAKSKSSENSTSANATNKIVKEIASAMIASDPDIPKEKPLHSVEHARQPQDDKETLSSVDKQVQVAAPSQPQDSAAHNATEKPKDVMTPGKSVTVDDMTTRLILKRESSNSTLNSSTSTTPSPTTEPAKKIRDTSGDDDVASEIDPEALKSSKREIQNVANILISSTKHIHNNKKEQKPQAAVEDPKCPTLSEFINGTKNLWDGLKTSGGVQDGLFSLFSAMSESVVVLAQCGLKLLSELGSFLNPSKNPDTNNNGQQDAQVETSTESGNKIISVIAVTEGNIEEDSGPLITMAPLVDNIDVEPQEKNLVNFNVDVSVIQTSTIKPNSILPLKEIVETTPSNKLIVETNVSKTEVVGTKNNPVIGTVNQPQKAVVETNVTKTDLVDLKPSIPAVLESNLTKTEVVDASSPKPTIVESNIPNIVILDTNSPRPANVDATLPGNMIVMDSIMLKPVTENEPTNNPNVFTINVYSINKEQAKKFFPSVLAKSEKGKMDNVENLSDYDYGDYSIESVNKPEDLKKKKRSGKSNRRSRKRTAKLFDREQKQSSN